MIDFHYKLDFKLDNPIHYSDWIGRVIESEGHQYDNIDFIFCDDDFLLELNQQYLNHDTLTDIITFDYTEGNVVSGDVFISVQRVRDNALKFEVRFDEELLRVMSHGVLHMMGYGDKSNNEAAVMRKKEDEKMKMFHVEQ